MRIKKNYIFLALLASSFQTSGQSINSDILSELSPNQIEIAKDLFEGDPSLGEQSNELEIPDESLIDLEEPQDSNIDNVTLEKFGYDFFSSMPTSLSALGDLPLPNDYKISLRDQLSIILTGSKDASYDLNVKLDGTILFPEIGSISIVGLSFNEVKEKLTDMINDSYIGVNIDVSVKNLSAKKITIVGAVNTPGTYLVNPFSTITGALAYSGGISELGSLRDIKLIRNSGEVFSFDLYELLIYGDRSNDKTIEAGDTILIGAASRFVEITGAIVRPAIYEVLDNESVEDIIDFSLGFTQAANKSNVSVSFLDLNNSTITMKTIENLEQNLDNALSIEVFEYVSQDTANVKVTGAIEEPGFYDLKKYEYLEDLLPNLNFKNTYPWLAVLEQFDDKNLIKSIILFSLKDPKTYKDIKLLSNSKIYFANTTDVAFIASDEALKILDEFSLNVSHKGNSYKLPVVGDFSVKELTDFLGIDMTDVALEASYISPTANISIQEDYRKIYQTASRFHSITFRTKSNDLIEVRIEGAVNFPGLYKLQARSSLQDLYNLIGGFKAEAYQEGIIFTRESIREKQLSEIQKAEASLKEQSLLLSLQDEEEFNTEDLDIYSNLSDVIDPESLGRIAGNYSENSKGAMETILVDGDLIIVPKNPYTINVFGEVLNPISFQYLKGLSVNEAIEMSGGLTKNSDKSSIYVIRANGLIERASRNVFLNNRTLEPGDTIVVSKKIISSNPVINSLTPITQILSNLAFSAAAIDNLKSN